MSELSPYARAILKYRLSNAVGTHLYYNIDIFIPVSWIGISIVFNIDEIKCVYIAIRFIYK